MVSIATLLIAMLYTQMIKYPVEISYKRKEIVIPRVENKKNCLRDLLLIIDV